MNSCPNPNQSGLTTGCVSNTVFVCTEDTTLDYKVLGKKTQKGIFGFKVVVKTVNALYGRYKNTFSEKVLTLRLRQMAAHLEPGSAPRLFLVTVAKCLLMG